MGTVRRPRGATSRRPQCHTEVPMEADTQIAQDAGVAKIRALLLAAKPGLVANARELATAFNQPLAPGAKVPDRSPGIAAFKQKLGALRADVEGTAVQGAGGVSAKRSEERRVGKEYSSKRARYEYSH